MDYVKIKDLKISKLTLGTAQLGFDYGIANQKGQPEVKQCYEILKTAIEGGINSFDTAPAYGESERILGQFFSSKTNILKNPVITTKLENIMAGGKDKVNDIIINQVENSLQTLALNRLPVLLVHNMNDFYQVKEEIIKCMLKLKEKGLVKNIGVSVYNPEDVKEVISSGKFDAIQIPINIMDHRLINSGLLKELENEGMIVFARSVFLQGIIFMEPEQLPKEMSFARKHILKLRELSQREGIGIAELAVTFVRDLSGISSLVIGSEKSEQVEENIKLMEKPQMKSEVREKIMEIFSDIPEKLVNPVLWN